MVERDPVGRSPSPLTCEGPSHLARALGESVCLSSLHWLHLNSEPLPRPPGSLMSIQEQPQPGHRGTEALVPVAGLASAAERTRRSHV